MTDPVILSIDQGTTSSRAILFDRAGKAVGMRQKELTLHYPQKGWVEQDPNDIWNDTYQMCRAVLADHRIDAAQIAAIGITNQRETTILWDRETGQPVYNAIVWQDRRTADYCAALKEQGHEDKVSGLTGLLLDPYFSATKIAWILDNVEGVRAKAESGRLAFGTVDSWLLWKLTGGAVHATDATNASRTMLCNIKTQQWDDSLLRLFNIPRSLLSDIYDNAADFGRTSAALFGAKLMIGGMAGDQQAAMIGQACFTEGMVKSTYGTGCFALMNSGETCRRSAHKLLTTPAYRIGGKTTYAVEGSIFVAGAAVQWLRDGLKLFDDAAQSEDMATHVPDNGGIYFVPAFTGLGAPYWDPHARASITGLGRDTTAAHIVRAALEAQAYQTCDLMRAMTADTGFDPALIRADGGMVANGFVCQFLADMLGKPVEIPQIAETTAQGAAYLAGLQCGFFNDLDDIAASWHMARRYEPAMESQNRAALYEGWQDAVQRTLSGN